MCQPVLLVRLPIRVFAAWLLPRSARVQIQHGALAVWVELLADHVGELHRKRS